MTRQNARKPRLKAATAAVTETQTYLQRLGARVREERARRGMALKTLARDSGVSIRYLILLESGKGNISIALLRKIAAALNTPVAELLRDEPADSVDLHLITEYLRKLKPESLPEVRRLLHAQFGGADDQRRAKRIALIGLRGAGKTTLGHRLADRLGVPFVELDNVIEREAGVSLGEVFALYDQASYRRFERQALNAIIRDHTNVVIAAGGSIVADASTFDYLLSCCYTIWLKASPEEHMTRVMAQGDFRPMAGNKGAMDDLRRILAVRGPLYAKADACVDTSRRSIDECFEALLAGLPR